jgi:predicted metalloenzyme YecM
MANWQSIDELHDISADLPRFTQAFTELATRLGLDIAPLEADHISLRCHQNATASAGVAGLNSAASCCRRISLTVAPSACSNCVSR